MDQIKENDIILTQSALYGKCANWSKMSRFLNTFPLIEVKINFIKIYVSSYIMKNIIAS